MAWIQSRVTDGHVVGALVVPGNISYTSVLRLACFAVKLTRIEPFNPEAMPTVAKPVEYCSHHVLDFLLDDEDSAALTVYTEDNTRMHIIADASRLKESSVKTKGRTYDEFRRLIAVIRKSSDEEGGNSRDSGVEMNESEHATSNEDGSGVDCVEDAEEALQSWMLEPVRRQAGKKPQEQLSLHDYYEAETQFFELDISKKDELCAVELEASSELKRRISKLKPEITLPKYIRDVDVPWFDSRKLTMLAGSASPPPYHPTQVRCEETGETMFFKAVDSYAPQTTKRELWHLNRIAQPDIADKIRAPRLVGFVADNTSKTRAIGFLQQNIPGSAPLTDKVRPEVLQDKRDAWASEADRMTKNLHECNIVWGDAKADNFLVDKHDKLWIIDFGGSWTEGWIDPEIKETVQGDNMAMEKITNALHDPVANVEGATEEAESPRGSKSHESSQAAQGVKRKASESAPENSEDDDEEEESHQHRNGDTKKHKPAEEEVEEVAREVSPPSDDAEEPEVVPTPPKRRKSKQIENQAAERYCYCDSPSAGPMVGCDNPDCERQWFHFYCAGLKRSPPEDVAWFCRDCST